MSPLNLLYGLLAAMTYALSGYLKHHPIEKFDPEKFMATILIGLIIGFAAAYYNVPPEQAHQTYLINTGLVVLIENAVKIVYRRVKEPKEEEGG